MVNLKIEGWLEHSIRNPVRFAVGKGIIQPPRRLIFETIMNEVEGNVVLVRRSINAGN